ncbi:S1 family peptidase [Lysobacter niastensis]|nr:trypsin-like serine protease [Lysobacter niastensis]
MKLSGLSALLLVALGVGSAAPALAMTNGTPADGDGHPAVVALLRSDGYWARPFCSGILLTGKVVLTASHCLQAALFFQQSGSQILATNDSQLQQDSAGWLPISTLIKVSAAASIVLNPAYRNGYDHDVSAMVLASPIDVPADAFPALPPTNILDELKASKYLQQATFAVLGYGIVEKPKGRWVSQFTGERRVGLLGFSALDKRFIHQSQLVNKGEDGACNGDSGGPSLLQIGGTNYVVGVTSTGDIPCYSTNVAARTDTDEALDFLTRVLAENP